MVNWLFLFVFCCVSCVPFAVSTSSFEVFSDGTCSQRFSFGYEEENQCYIGAGFGNQAYLLCNSDGSWMYSSYASGDFSCTGIVISRVFGTSAESCVAITMRGTNYWIKFKCSTILTTAPVSTKPTTTTTRTTSDLTTETTTPQPTFPPKTTAIFTRTSSTTTTASAALAPSSTGSSPPSIDDAAIEPTNSSKSSMSPFAFLFLFIGLGVSALLVGLIVYCFCKKRRENRIRRRNLFPNYGEQIEGQPHIEEHQVEGRPAIELELRIGRSREGLPQVYVNENLEDSQPGAVLI